jgi:hypothetical protein
MRKASLTTLLAAVFMAAVFVIPSVSAAAGKAGTGDYVTAVGTIGLEAIDQEVIQTLRKGETSTVTLNIIGRPGVYFRAQYSASGEAGSFAPVPNGKGVIGDNGLGSVILDLSKLGRDAVYLMISASDTADFAKARVTPRPIVLQVDYIKVKTRGAFEDLQRIEKWGGRSGNSPSFCGRYQSNCR